MRWKEDATQELLMQGAFREDEGEETLKWKIKKGPQPAIKKYSIKLILIALMIVLTMS